MPIYSSYILQRATSVFYKFVPLLKYLTSKNNTVTSWILPCPRYPYAFHLLIFLLIWVPWCKNTAVVAHVCILKIVRCYVSLISFEDIKLNNGKWLSFAFFMLGCIKIAFLWKDWEKPSCVRIFCWLVVNQNRKADLSFWDLFLYAPTVACSVHLLPSGWTQLLEGTFQFALHLMTALETAYWRLLLETWSQIVVRWDTSCSFRWRGWWWRWRAERLCLCARRCRPVW